MKLLILVLVLGLSCLHFCTFADEITMGRNGFRDKPTEVWSVGAGEREKIGKLKQVRAQIKSHRMGKGTWDTYRAR
ncbi:hypothetical protein M426DRAFT_323719 [Hypoxylon sp. CI-4A]|nr:hypothetical protein M426DRAFT_323719 [Hypoxylon sp. CI-4A]